MIHVLASAKGEGKTKRLIEMANDALKNANGHIVFIDDDSRHIYDLHYDIRFIQTTDYNVAFKDEFYGFLCGILSQDRDIEKIYIDGLTNMVKDLNTEGMIELVNKLKQLAENHNIDIVLSLNCKASDLPEDLQSIMVA